MAASNSPAEKLITENIDVWTSAIKKRGSQGRGSSKKIELYGIKKLRELILELAVRGLLVPQDPNDEPASVLLKKIAAEKEQLIKDGKIKKQKALPEISEDEKPFALPNGWEWSRVAFMGIGSTGKTPKTSMTECFNGNIPFIGPGQITPLGKLLDSDKTLTEVGLGYSTEANIGDILMVCIGGSIGKASIADKRISFNQQINALQPLIASSGYLYIAMTANFFYQSVLASSTGSATPIINRMKWEELLVPLPPEAEQPRIVAKVDELMALCDQLEQQTETSLSAHQTLVETLLNTLLNADQNSFDQAWKRIAQHFDVLFTTEHSIDQLKQTILQLAVMGKLVPQDPNDEPASVLLEKIAAEKEQLIKDKVIKKQKPLPPISEDEKPFELPKGWEWAMMGDLAEYQKGYAFKSKDYLDKGLMITKIQNLTENSIQNSVYIAPEKTLDFEQYTLKESDIVMTTVGSWFSAPDSAVGRSFLINKIFDSSLLNQNAVRIRFRSKLSSMYLFYCVNSPVFKKYLLQEAQGTANQASITQSSIKTFVLSIPPEAEQPRIVAIVDELISLCDELKGRLQDSQTTQLHLADAMAEQALSS